MRCISHSTHNTSGSPSAAPSSVCLARSAKNSRRVILLKPKRASMTKVRYSDSGRSMRPEIRATLTMRAMLVRIAAGVEGAQPGVVQRLQRAAQGERQQEQRADAQVDHGQARLVGAVIGCLLVRGQVDVFGEVRRDLVTAARDVADVASREPQAQAYGEGECCKKDGGESLHLAEI